MDVKFDFSDVDGWFDEQEQSVLSKEREIADEAVQYAKDNGDYQNRTGVLRASNEGEVDKEGITLKNEAEYASYVEAKGFDVLGNAALFAEKRAKEEFE